MYIVTAQPDFYSNKAIYEGFPRDPLFRYLTGPNQSSHECGGRDKASRLHARMVTSQSEAQHDVDSLHDRTADICGPDKQCLRLKVMKQSNAFSSPYLPRKNLYKVY
jgi:hypothetical protein